MKKDTLNLLFSTFLFLMFTLAIFEALTFSRLAQFFPLYISIAGSVLTLIYLIKQLFELYKQKEKEGEATKLPILKPLRYIAWIIGYLLLIYIGGLMLATAIFLMVFLIFESKMTFLQTSISVVVVLVGVSALSSALNIYWPTNILGF